MGKEIFNSHTYSFPFWGLGAEKLWTCGVISFWIWFTMDFIKVLDFLMHTLGAGKVSPLLIVLFVGEGGGRRYLFKHVFNTSWEVLLFRVDVWRVFLFIWEFFLPLCPSYNISTAALMPFLWMDKVFDQSGMENRKCSFVLGMHTANCGVGVHSLNQRVSCVKREMQIVGGPREPRSTCIVLSNLMCQAAKGKRAESWL